MLGHWSTNGEKDHQGDHFYDLSDNQYVIIYTNDE